MVEAPFGYTPIQRIFTGAPVAPIAQALAAHPDLWNERTDRTAAEDSPHHGLDDIWARFADPRTMRADGSHDSVWYPPARLIPGLRGLVLDVMRRVDGTQLGGVLITRIPAGQQCKPHVDPGWHARHYQKFGIQIAADPETQAFHFAGHELRTAPGDVFWFDNAYTHWVTNEGPHDRITVIACIRTERN